MHNTQMEAAALHDSSTRGLLTPYSAAVILQFIWNVKLLR